MSFFVQKGQYRGKRNVTLAKRMGMLPSSLYRKLARESMTLEELQKCLDMLEAELEAARKAVEFHKKSLRDLRTELNSAVG